MVCTEETATKVLTKHAGTYSLATNEGFTRHEGIYSEASDEGLEKTRVYITAGQVSKILTRYGGISLREEGWVTPKSLVLVALGSQCCVEQLVLDGLVVGENAPSAADLASK